jgi:Ca2+-binding RTX toxin-like protein
MPPVNDNFANSITLIALEDNSISTTSTNVDSTAETGEPNHAGVSSPLNSVWWNWTAPSTGSVTINTFGSNYDTTLAVYTGSAVNSLSAIASNDDSGSLQSAVTFTATAGTTYQIAVDGYIGSIGSFNLNLNFPTPPSTSKPADFGFESGNFTNWATLGNASIQTAAFGTPPTEGNFQALITTASPAVSDAALENFLGLNAGAIDALGNGNATEGSALKLNTITVQAGEVVSFDWDFLTDEGTPSFFNDFAFVSITPALVSELADTSSVFALSPTPFNQETGYQTFEYKFTTAGTYTVGVGVVDVGDTVVDSGLLVDNLNIFSEILGTPGNDNLNGTGADERINGLDGNDNINGNGGHDTLLGGAGDDTIAGGSDDDRIDGGDGNDTIFGNGGRDTLTGGAGNDQIFGSSQAELIFGGDGDDTIFGNGGDDIINSGAGNDTISLGTGNARVALETGSGFDTIVNFQLGATTLGITGINDISIVDDVNGARISQGGDLLAVVSSTQASILSNNFSDVFFVS